ncbi:HIT family protein [Micromonospora sp. NPDC051296]|uniref:HIT family protein n=1 Tax=Micromonospora sp. NPDC051296 TaxID=3155046 RepID=UPI00343B042A
MDCYVCRNNDQFNSLPPRERVAADAHWRVAHAFDSTVAGWLILVPRRHVTSIAELTDVEAASLGTWQVQLSRALAIVTGCVKTYVMQYAERDGFGHVHFHVVPRMPDIPHDRRGPRVFAYLDAPPDQRIPESRLDAFAAELQNHLSRGSGMATATATKGAGLSEA